MELPARKPARLPGYDYAANGAYFVTICSHDKACIFGSLVGADSIRPPKWQPTACGLIVENAICQIPDHYPGVSVDAYVIMPNHVHLLLRFSKDDGRLIAAPTLSRVIGQMKRYVSKTAGFSVWQKSFYEHVIRNEQDHLDCWRYIEENPMAWEQKD